MDRLQPVPRIGQRTVHDGRERIRQVALSDRATQGFCEAAGWVYGIEIIVGHDGSDTVAGEAQQASIWEIHPYFPLGHGENQVDD